MSNFDNFDIDQISSKFAQRKHFICYFYSKKISILSGLDNTENAKRQFFLGHPILFHNSYFVPSKTFGSSIIELVINSNYIVIEKNSN